MNRFATIIPAIRFKKVTYYTVQLEEEKGSLFLQFIHAHTGKEYSEQLSLIRSWLRKIGEEIGADDRYFRMEGFRGGDARALPPPARYINIDCNLRLYCMLVSRSAVILFGGAKKTATAAQDCDNVRPHFLLANRLAKAIDQAIKDKDIQIDSETGHLLFDDNLILEI